MARCLEALGRIDEARERYARTVELLDEADPKFLPLRLDAERRLAALSAG